jgi:deoxyribonuclease-4
MLIGAHLSVSPDFAGMCATAARIKANSIQIFTSSPQMWRGKKYKTEDGEKLQNAMRDNDIRFIVSHDAYLINLASQDAEILGKSLQAINDEILRCGALSIPYLVMHQGAYKGGTLEDGQRTFAASLNEIIPLANDNGVTILLECTAGQGTYLGGEFEQFVTLFNMIPEHEKLGVCIDTCHIFVAGYDIRTKDGYESVMANFDKTAGLGKLKLIHMNDTEKLLASHSDRHADIGKGELGTDPFKWIINDPRLIDVPKVLETPGDVADYERNLNILWDLVE